MIINHTEKLQLKEELQERRRLRKERWNLFSDTSDMDKDTINQLSQSEFNLYFYKRLAYYAAKCVTAFPYVVWAATLLFILLSIHYNGYHIIPSTPYIPNPFSTAQGIDKFTMSGMHLFVSTSLVVTADMILTHLAEYREAKATVLNSTSDSSGK